jgi:methionyl-tRNA formyltransferase
VAAACLGVIARDAGVALVVTQPRRRRGRGGEMSPTPVAEEAARLALPVLETADVNAQSDVARIASASPRLLVVVAFGQMLRRAVRDTAPLGGVNLHFSLLPRWRGAAPVQRAILAGDTETGVAVQRLVAKLDAGPVLACVRVAIGPRDTTPVLLRRLTETGSTLLCGVVLRLLADAPPAESPQDEALVTYAAKIGRAEGDLDFAVEDAVSLDRRIRAFADGPGCRATLAREGAAPMDVLIREASPVPAAAGAPGRVLAASADGVVVAARDGALRIARLQRVGGKDVDVRSFLNGFPVRPGDRFERAGQRDNSASTAS